MASQIRALADRALKAQLKVFADSRSSSGARVTSREAKAALSCLAETKGLDKQDKAELVAKQLERGDLQLSSGAQQAMKNFVRSNGGAAPTGGSSPLDTRINNSSLKVKIDGDTVVNQTFKASGNKITVTGTSIDAPTVVAQSVTLTIGGERCHAIVGRDSSAAHSAQAIVDNLPAGYGGRIAVAGNGRTAIITVVKE